MEPKYQSEAHPDQLDLERKKARRRFKYKYRTKRSKN